jgi:uncharacterized Ntn-hydrolase superfamily protein
MTLSIASRCSKTGDFGICVVTSNLAVGNLVPHIKPNIGAICTQGRSNASFGINGLKLLEIGFSPETCLDTLLNEDESKDSRQLVILDRFNRIATFSGECCVKWKGHLVGDCYAIAGNKLEGKNVLEKIEREFVNSQGDLTNRLLGAIEATEFKTSRGSAALFVARSDQSRFPSNIRLHVDYHKDPIKELRNIFEEYAIYTNLFSR